MLPVFITRIYRVKAKDVNIHENLRKNLCFSRILTVRKLLLDTLFRNY